MGQITIKISDQIETKLRVTLAQQGRKKGSLSKAIEEAIILWLTNQTK